MSEGGNNCGMGCGNSGFTLLVVLFVLLVIVGSNYSMGSGNDCCGGFGW